MKLQRLSLAPFGPFEDKTLELSGERLTVVYGANEAGKSSALRALGDFFYGIPSRTVDNFRFDNRRLRLRGEIVLADGQRISLERQKKNKDDLRLSDGTVVPPEQMAGWLSHTSRELFESLFGINHEELRNSSEAILQENGEVGRVLFAAASGSRHLAETRRALSEQAAEIYKPRGHKQALNEALSAYKTAVAELKSAQLATTEFESRRDELDSAKAVLQQTREAMSSATTRLQRLQNELALKPLLASHGRLSAELGDYQDVPLLDEDFAARHNQVREDLASIRARLEDWHKSLQELDESMPQVDENAPLLQAAERIEQLKGELGSYRDAVADLAALQPELRAHDSEYQHLCEQLKGEPADWQAALDVKQSLLRVAGEVSEAHRACQQLRDEIRNLETEQAQLPSLDTGAAGEDDGALGLALARVLPEQHLSDECDTLAVQVRVAEQQLSRDVNALSGWQDGVEALLNRAFPTEARLEDLAGALLQADNRVQAQEDTVAALQKSLDEAQSRYGALKADGKVPPPEALEARRGDRDAHWRSIRRGIAGESPLPPPAALDQYEGRVIEADELADALRENADWVSQLALAEDAVSEQDSALQAARETLSRLQAAQADCREAWQKLWLDCGVTPGSATEMRGWLRSLDEIRRRATQLLQDRERLNQLESRRDQLTTLMREALAAFGVSDAGHDFQALLQRCQDTHRECQTALEAQRKLEEQHATLERQQRTRQRQLSQAEQHQQETLQAWQDAVPGIGPAEPDDAGDWLQRLETALEAGRRLAQIRSREAQLQARISAFESGAAELAPLLESADTPESAAQRVALVHGRLRDYQRRHEDYSQRQVRRAQLTEKISDGQARRRELEVRLAELMREAACDEVDGIAAVISAARQKQVLLSQLAGVEAQIESLGQGSSIADLSAALADISSEALNEELSRLRLQIDQELQPANENAAQRLGEASDKLNELRGGDEAALLAVEVSALRERAREHAAHYLQLKLAATILANETERFRQEHQGPLLAKASALFAQLTGGAFCALDADADGKQVVLAAYRAGDEARQEPVRVGGMSSGTRDQLYLALRLASLERYIAENGAVPFIVDDILIEFDDERTRAALACLKDFSAHTQVVLFTHHEHVVRSAEALGDITIERL
ncbi:AAA family ATPase [Granulosicoccaceae sp. 1_MG-2023]|nr:AAA family ATPase [Granulosicoccaceae sp. 1_MG-2023]